MMYFTDSDETQTKPSRSKFQRQFSILFWKSYLQRRRRWRILVTETIFAGILFVVVILEARPIFLTPLQAHPDRPLSDDDILKSLEKQTEIGFYPMTPPYMQIMQRAAQLLEAENVVSATSESNLIMKYINSSLLTNPVIWIQWNPKKNNVWSFSIRSTERAKFWMSAKKSKSIVRNPHLRAGFLGVQLAISRAILEYTTGKSPSYKLFLASMPVSPLMRENLVTDFLSVILMCYTIAFIPPIVDISIIVVKESRDNIKHALRLRGVDYATIYLGWLSYAGMTAIPICLLGSITLILIFRWVHLIYAFVFITTYFINMTVFVLILTMFHDKVIVSCIWSTLFLLFQTFLAGLLLQHQKTSYFYYPLMIIVPSLGLVHGFNYFALLRTGQSGNTAEDLSVDLTLGIWVLVAVVYFTILMVLQKVTVHAIGGQVSIRALMSKSQIDKVNEIRVTTSRDRKKLQEVDELVAKAISFRNVSKEIMGNQILNDITFDIYRSELTMIHCEPIQEAMMNTLEDLITGLTHPDSGTIYTLGMKSEPDNCFMTQIQSMGYCHSGKCFIEELTVIEHIEFFIGLSLWNESSESVFEYTHLRTKQLIKECDLEAVKNERVRDIHAYYKAQLCWAIAILLEPRIVVIPNHSYKPLFLAIIKDKITRYRKCFTIIKITYTSIDLEYADRIFVFDNTLLVFGGTAAYVFFKYGRDYRVRITLRQSDDLDNKSVNELIANAKNAGATVRAYLGSLLILKVPVTPTAVVSALVKDWHDNATKYGITTMNITLSDTNEVVKRAINEVRDLEEDEYLTMISNEALRKMAEPPTWKRRNPNPTILSSITHFKTMVWKYITFHVHHKGLFLITLICAVISGILMGMTFSNILSDLEKSHTNDSLHGKKMSVEELMHKTTLILRSDDSDDSISVANAYVLSDSNYKKIQFIQYTALNNTESLTEYLVNHAIDDPQLYVSQYAYGMDIINVNESIYVKALYSPLHRDESSATRSLARVYMALLRHFSGNIDAAIQVIDDPLALDVTPWLKEATESPLLIEFFVILTMCHMTLIPSKEHRLIRHMQVHALDYSPTQYWVSLYICDIITYFILVTLMGFVMLGVIVSSVEKLVFQLGDLLIVPLLLLVYGIGSIPFAYIFSLGPRPALNAMSFVVMDILFGESTSIARYFHGVLRNYVVKLMSISPLFNMAVAFIKIKKTFIYNTQCDVIKSKDLCNDVMLHKCCEYCGVMQECFSPRCYFIGEEGIYLELITIVATALMYMVILLLWEYKMIQYAWKKVVTDNMFPSEEIYIPSTIGTKREMEEVLDKRAQLHDKHCAKVNTYGEYILCKNLCKHWLGMYELKNIYLGIGKGEILALAGLESHGRSTLCEVLAGDKMFDDGEVWSMSKWSLIRKHHQYTRQTTICCNKESLPFWMTVRDALEFIALLRGLPRKHIKNEVTMHIEALELGQVASTRICDLSLHYKTRLNFAAAVIAAPPIIILDECTAYQDQAICRAMYFILYLLRKRGHAIFISSSSVESHLPVTTRIAFIIDGRIYDVDHVDSLLARYSHKGYTVVVHLKDDIDIKKTFRKYFNDFVINDVNLVLVNIQIMDASLNWAGVFNRMEKLQAENSQVYSYIICSIPIDYVYNVIIVNESGRQASDRPFWQGFKKKAIVTPSKETIEDLKKLERKYCITSLNFLPWSVIFQR